MKDKLDLKTSDVMIAGRQIDMVAPYSVRECILKLQSLKKGGFLARERIDVRIDSTASDETGVSFEIKRSVSRGKSRDAMRVKGHMQAIDSGTTEIHGEVPSPDAQIAFGLFLIVGVFLFVIVLIPPYVWDNSGDVRGFLIVGVTVFVLFYLFLSKLNATGNKNYMLNLLRDTLR